MPGLALRAAEARIASQLTGGSPSPQAGPARSCSSRVLIRTLIQPCRADALLAAPCTHRIFGSMQQSSRLRRAVKVANAGGFGAFARNNDVSQLPIAAMAGPQLLDWTF